MTDAAFRGNSRRNLSVSGRRRRRLYYRGMEAAADASAWLCGLLAAAWVTHDVAAPGIKLLVALRAAVAIAVLSAGCGVLGGLYRDRYQRGSFDELIAVGRAGAGMLIALAVLSETLIPGQREPLHTIACGAAITLLAILGGRSMVAAARQWSPFFGSSGVKIIVFGAGDAGTQLIQGLARQPAPEYRPVALLDDDPVKRRLKIHGLPVLGDRTLMAQVAARTGASVLVIAIARTRGSGIRELTEEAERCGLIPKVIPSVAELLNGGARIEGVRDPRISDLLGRRQVSTDIGAVAAGVSGKRILVTGAGGSIGSELCRQLHRFGPSELIMLDRDESALHAVQLALDGRALLDCDQLVLADIRDPVRVREVFRQFRPQIVFHAAALKHLPLLERYPAEALKSNVWGTLTVLEAAAANGVSTFVNISTDKAADPVSVLGYSKRIAERLTAHVAGQSAGTYLSVRFGNVLGSRGSFLTALSAQVAAGGPLTVTHPDVSRYFMTASEAVQLVLQAAVIGRDGEVLVLDMGAQVRIADIARRLADSTPEPIDIVFTGLRPGEKMTENLLGSDEVGERLQHPLIRHVAVSPISPEEVAGLDAGLPSCELRAVLAQCAERPARPSVLSADYISAQPLPSPGPSAPPLPGPRPSAQTRSSPRPAVSAGPAGRRAGQR